MAQGSANNMVRLCFCPMTQTTDDRKDSVGERSLSETTHFGFRDVDTGEKASLVKGVFDRVAFR